MPGARTRDPQGRGYSAGFVVRTATALVALLSVVVGLFLGVTVVQVADAQSKLEDDLNPSRVELGKVLALYVDQETGQRGYILTGQTAFLDPYQDAVPRIEANLADLRRQSSPALQARIGTMVEAHAAWLAAAERELDAVRAGDRAEAIRLVEAGEGKELFDRLRVAQAAADAQVAVEQSAATERADSLLRRLALLLGLTVAAFLLTALLAWVAFGRTILGPLASLGAGSRAVASGRLDQAVTVRGPREVESVATDVDTMRQHLLDELDASRRAVEALELGEPAVAALRDALAPRPLRRRDLAVAGEIVSAEGVLAGDFLDVVELADDRVAVVLGDVTGHGPTAALVGLRLKIAIATALDRVDLAEVLPAARALLAEQPEMFVTVVVAILDTRAGTLAYVNAGHPPPILGDAGLEPTGPLVSAVLDDATWEVRVLPVGPGDLLICFSDGVLEARDREGREFGADGVSAALHRVEGRPVEEIVRALRSEVRDHEHQIRDDVTILVVRPHLLVEVS